jgi:hypothetical protein
MKRNQKESKQRRQMLQVWTRDQAIAALPYIASVLRSLREHKLEAQTHQLTAHRLAERPGRPARDSLIAQEEALREARKAEERFQEALDELQALDLYCLDPIAGQALVPFVQDDQLAWYIFDLFDTDPLRFWRFHSDPLEMRRPLNDDGHNQAEPSTRLA